MTAFGLVIGVAVGVTALLHEPGACYDRQGGMDVGQSVLKGPSDVLCTALREFAMEEPEELEE